MRSPRPRRTSSRQDHPDLEGLAEADRVGEQDPRADVLRIEGLGTADFW